MVRYDTNPAKLEEMLNELAQLVPEDLADSIYNIVPYVRTNLKIANEKLLFVAQHHKRMDESARELSQKILFLFAHKIFNKELPNVEV